ncbi:MAG: hypothetical protein WCJ92_02890 [Alphaproteobacteria bacterium]
MKYFLTLLLLTTLAAGDNLDLDNSSTLRTNNTNNTADLSQKCPLLGESDEKITRNC